MYVCTNQETYGVQQPINAGKQRHKFLQDSVTALKSTNH